MLTALLPALINLLNRLLDLLQSKEFQAKLKEAQNVKRENEARKALLKKDAALIAALSSDQHDRVLALCGGAGRRNDTGERPTVGPDAPG